MPLPPNDLLIIYELHVGDFTGGEGDDGAGRYADVIAKLPYLADLGITAIELMPVQETAGDYWGYLPKYFYAPETAYGNPSDLKALIDACHGQGIRVILDKVTNHAGSECPLAHIDHDYWFYHETTDEFQYGPKFNYEFHDDARGEYPARAFMLGALQYWVEAYHVDGIRFDATRIMGNMDFLREASQAIWEKEGGLKPFVRIAEHLPLDIAVVEDGGPMDAAWFVDFAHQIASTLIGQPQDGHDPDDWQAILAALDPRRAGFTSGQHLVRYIASHDEERLLYRIHAAGIEGEDALRRMHFAITLLLTGYGYPMLYAGEEFGMDTPRVIGENKLAWSRLDTPEGSGHARPLSPSDRAAARAPRPARRHAGDHPRGRRGARRRLSPLGRGGRPRRHRRALLAGRSRRLRHPQLADGRHVARCPDGRSHRSPRPNIRRDPRPLANARAHRRAMNG